MTPNEVWSLYNHGAPGPPPHPERLRMLIYGFARFADEREAEMAGAKRQKKALGG